MRDIKFRAWCKYIDHEIFKNQMYYDIENWTFEDNNNNLGHMLQHPEGWEIMQYTGMKDKYGKEIYEGDILGFKDKRYKKGLGERKEEIKFDDDIYCEEYGSYIGFENFMEDCKTLEVIGNIYENPELLKE